MSERYSRSKHCWKGDADDSPGTQTFSKSKTQFPHGVSPYYIFRGQGSRVWDADGNEYVDFINSLAAVTLGYNDPEVTAAVRAQLEEGVIFSLPHPVEIEVAEKIVEMVPCAEMVRFGKNGSDTTAGAVRIARAYTGRDHVAVCGYHGWQDWYIGSTTRNLGVPRSTRELTHSFAYNSPESLRDIFRRLPGQVAAVILEPMNLTEPTGGFLQRVAEIARENGAVLIFDETVTGFRFANGGAQEYFGVTPDLATFGKGLANGYAVSAVAGSAQLMRLMEEVFFSFTFGGETLSLAASLATMKKMQREPVVDTLACQGRKLLEGLSGLIAKHDVGHFLSTTGHPAWSFLVIREAGSCSVWEIKTFSSGDVRAGRADARIPQYVLLPQRCRRDWILRAYDEVLPILKDAVEREDGGVPPLQAS
jgi:glutamate-1-semialdehyde 2,1-aminomutase